VGGLRSRARLCKCCFHRFWNLRKALVGGRRRNFGPEGSWSAGKAGLVASWRSRFVIGQLPSCPFLFRVLKYSNPFFCVAELIFKFSTNKIQFAIYKTKLIHVPPPNPFPQTS
jgi:hypothetical protein